MMSDNGKQNSIASTMENEKSRICGTDSLYELVSKFDERRKLDAEINNSDWRLGDDNHVDSYYLGSQRLHKKLQTHRKQVKEIGEVDGYNVHYHPELHASWTFGIYGVGSEKLCKIHNERQTKQLKSGDVRYNRQKWRQVEKTGKIAFGGRQLPHVSLIKKRARPCAFSESFVIRDRPQGHELTWNDRQKINDLSTTEVEYRLSRLHVSPIKPRKKNWRYNQSYFMSKLGLDKTNEKIWIA